MISTSAASWRTLLSLSTKGAIVAWNFIACGWLIKIIGIKFKYLPEKNFNKGKKIERERGDDDDRVWITSVLLIMSHKETIERKGESI